MAELFVWEDVSSFFLHFRGIGFQGLGTSRAMVDFSVAFQLQMCVEIWVSGQTTYFFFYYVKKQVHIL